MTAGAVTLRSGHDDFASATPVSRNRIISYVIAAGRHRRVWSGEKSAPIHDAAAQTGFRDRILTCIKAAKPCVS
jgi:hypothetical protein